MTYKSSQKAGDWDETPLLFKFVLSHPTKIHGGYGLIKQDFSRNQLGSVPSAYSSVRVSDFNFPPTIKSLEQLLGQQLEPSAELPTVTAACWVGSAGGQHHL